MGSDGWSCHWTVNHGAVTPGGPDVCQILLLFPQLQSPGARQAELCPVRGHSLSWESPGTKAALQHLLSIAGGWTQKNLLFSLSLSPSNILKPLTCHLLELNLSSWRAWCCCIIFYMVKRCDLLLLLLSISAWVLPNFIFSQLMLIGFLVHSKEWTWGEVSHYPVVKSINIQAWLCRLDFTFRTLDENICEQRKWGRWLNWR